MSNTEKPAWLDQVQQFQSDDRALKATQGEDVTHDPEAVGAALGVIAEGLEAEAVQPAGQEVAGIGDKAVVQGSFALIHQEDVRVGGKVVAHGAFGLTHPGNASVAPVAAEAVEHSDESVCDRIAEALHYPACWDTAAYPTLESAVWEAIACANIGCSECEPAGASVASASAEEQSELIAMVDNNIETLGNIARIADGKSLSGLSTLLCKVSDTLSRCREKLTTHLSETAGAAAAPEGAFLTICREELVRGTLTSLPLKVAFAKQRGMTFEQVDTWMLATRAAFRTAVEAAGGPVPEVTQLANKYLVLRSVENNSAKFVELPAAARERKIHRVWLLYDEAKFVSMGKPAHHVNAFLDDRGHDWDLVHRAGKTYLRYYAHSSAKGDVVDVLVEFEE